jgi:hypothetical protein
MIAIVTYGNAQAYYAIKDPVFDVFMAGEGP